jgi:sec-independent protein translocase protein TatA
MFEGLLQPLHLLLIVGIALLCFGPRQFTDFGKGVGDGIRNFKSALEQSDGTSKRLGARTRVGAMRRRPCELFGNAGSDAAGTDHIWT